MKKLTLVLPLTLALTMSGSVFAETNAFYKYCDDLYKAHNALMQLRQNGFSLPHMIKKYGDDNTKRRLIIKAFKEKVVSAPEDRIRVSIEFAEKGTLECYATAKPMHLR